MDQLRPEEILSEEERKACKDAFDSYDKLGYGTIEIEELQKVLEEYGQKPSQEDLMKMMKQFDQGNKGYLDFKDFLRAISFYKLLEQESEEDDTLDAFVAMGGNSDKTGVVESRRLIDIIKGDFKMTIDIERLISEMDSDKSGFINFPEFKNLLSQ